MGNFIVEMINALISGLASALSTIILILPDSPFEAMNNLTLDNVFLEGLMWIIPINHIISFLQAWVGAIAVYYIVMIALRWLKAIE